MVEGIYVSHFSAKGRKLYGSSNGNKVAPSSQAKRRRKARRALRNVRNRFSGLNKRTEIVVTWNIRKKRAALILMMLWTVEARFAAIK